MQPPRNGWLIPPGDALALFNAMSEAADLSDDDMATRSDEAGLSVAAHSPLPL